MNELKIYLKKFSELNAQSSQGRSGLSDLSARKNEQKQEL